MRLGRSLTLCAVLVLTGCFDSGRPFRLPIPSAPVPAPPGDATPQEAMRRLEWSWNNRSPDAYRALFSQNYVFVFSALDPYGAAYQSNPWTRDDEMAFAQHLFVTGNPVEPAATNIILALDRNLTVRDDARPGKNPAWHQVIHTSVALLVVTASKQTIITGFWTLYLARGDSAQVPVEIQPLGFRPDSTHWYIDRWEDDTALPLGSRTMPTHNATVGALKALYR